MDPYFAVAYFQMGVSHFVLNDMEAARRDFDLAYEVRYKKRIAQKRFI